MTTLVTGSKAGHCGPPGRCDDWNPEMTHPHTDRFAGSSSDSSHRASEAVLGPFTLREAVIGGSVLLIFIGSMLPFFEASNWLGNLWNASSLFFLGIGIILPVATAGLIAARRLGTDLRIGSLSVDQFASVVAVLAATFFFLQTVTSFHLGPLVCLIGGIGMLAATVGGPHLPMFAQDFAGRPSSNAHLVARRILPAAPKNPKASQPVAAEQVTEFTPQSGATAAAGASSTAAGVQAGHAGTTSQPVAQKKSAGIAGKLGFGAAAKSSSDHRAPSASDAHLSSGVGAAAGVQDKELADADSSGYPRFADEDFAPYGTSPDSAQSSGSKPSPEPSPEGNSDTDVSSPTAAPTSVATGQQATAPREATGPETSSTTASAAEPAATAAATTSQPVVESQPSESQDSISATKDADDNAPVVEAFWFAVGSPRPVVDEASGVELFVLRPGDWEVGIEDRGEEFLVQDKRTGRIGVMRDLTNIERAPSDG
ncbi:hypothetical protein GCM10009582_22360 [Arthrobacter flavus]